MFSFFRKEKSEDLMAFLKEGQPDVGQGPAYAPAKPKMEETGIEVVEAVGGLAPEFEEAAVMYANGRIGETATVLNRYLLDYPKSRDPLPWFMLFDLYEVTNQRDPFEDAAVDFAVKFERSPPTWHPCGPAAKPSQAAALMAYSETYGSMERVKHPKFFQDAANAPYVRLDVSKVQTPDAETAKAILDDILRLNEMKKPVELIGGAGFTVRMDSARHQADRLSEAAWFLLLAMLQLMGKESDFENVAVDYAVAFEVSPPSYTPPLPLPVHAIDAKQVENNDALYRLAGAIGPGTDMQIRELKRFAQGKTQVEVNMSAVTRIDFAVVGLLLELLIELSQKGVQVTFTEGNELVNTLLQIVGVNQFATIQPRPRV